MASYGIRYGYSGSGGEQTGYVSSKYIKFPTAIKSDSDFESYLTKQGFPESYKQGLRELACTISELDVHGVPDKSGLEHSVEK